MRRLWRRSWPVVLMWTLAAFWHRSWPVVLMWTLAAFLSAAWLVTFVPRDVASMTWGH